MKEENYIKAGGFILVSAVVIFGIATFLDNNTKVSTGKRQRKKRRVIESPSKPTQEDLEGLKEKFNAQG